ncbi:MAG: cellulase family glycosylhydrolase [Polyangiaceae bacterium]|nr:cellulase family glycosylhydrolase [Polyangiaceae bacterium]
MRAFNFFGVAACAAAILCTQTASANPLHSDGRFFRDDSGRAVILRGVNVAGNSKVPPFTGAFEPGIFAPLGQWGINVVRLLFTWEAYEPEPGQVNNDYLAQYKKAALDAWGSGLHVIVDFHQDAYSRYLIEGCGDGAPKWALPPDIAPATPDNGPACKNWGIKMQNNADMLMSWSAFHGDTYGAKTAYLNMVEAVSTTLADVDGVIGFDIMNEPWGDEATEIGPFYEEAAARIRKAQPDAIVFVSPHALTSSGKQSTLVKPSFDNIAYSPHFYDASVVLFGSWSGVLPDAPFANMEQIAADWNVPLFLGEYGAPGESENGHEYMNAILERLNAGVYSGAQWVYTPSWTEEKKDGWNTEDFSIVNDEGALRPNFVERPAPQKVSGTPITFIADMGEAPANRKIVFEWENEPQAGISELYIPREIFFETQELTFEANVNDVVCQFTTPIVTCTSSNPGKKKVTIVAAPPPANNELPKSCGLTGFEAVLLSLAGMLRLARLASIRKTG